MFLYIDTTHGHDIAIAVKDGKKIIGEMNFPARYSQAEKLLPAIDELLKGKKVKLSDIKKIIVTNRGGAPASKRGTSFTALRVGVVTANALGYALGMPVKGKDGKKLKMKKINVIKPIYNKEPNITIRKE